MDVEVIDIAKELYLLGCNILKNEPLKLHTTFKIGGKVPLFVIPKTKNVFVKTLNYLIEKNIKFKIIGGGANLIIKDENLDFVVVSTEYLTDVIFKEEYICSEVGIPISRLSYLAMENGLAGLEFASGIPGSLGGALFMNAGAYGGEMKNIVKEVEVYDIEKRQIITLKKEDIKFDYRKSIFQERRFIL
ncbi:FAD-binding protein [Marinitoga lauensis]|uniref:FAD-binding protein n=1 Tax=Marinitoga lauensis TaxID=2201189 RepID=UPI001F0F6F90|nr:FAD-binding protein [Marinitoga lauensis]